MLVRSSFASVSICGYCHLGLFCPPYIIYWCIYCNAAAFVCHYLCFGMGLLCRAVPLFKKLILPTFAEAPQFNQILNKVEALHMHN